METKELAARIEAAVPGSVLEMRPFGRGKAISVWIEMQSLPKVADFLCNDAATGFDWLENLSVMDIDRTLVFTYFLRSRTSSKQVIIRASVVPGGPQERAVVPSIEGVWPMGRDFEQEIGDLFGVTFQGCSWKGATVLPEDWIGFPLRKSYVFPSEFMDILHMRPAGRGGAESMGSAE